MVSNMSWVKLPTKPNSLEGKCSDEGLCSPDLLGTATSAALATPAVLFLAILGESRPLLDSSHPREHEGRIQHPWDFHPTSKSGSNQPQSIKPHTHTGRRRGDMCHPTAVTPPPAHPFPTSAISDAQVPAGQAHHGGLLGALVSCVLLKAAGGSWGQARQLPAPRQGSCPVDGNSGNTRL